MPAADVQGTVDEIFRRQEKAQFGAERYALLFKPGTYHVNLRVGFYTQVLGLGALPEEVKIIGHVSADAKWARGNATVNFWRGVENLEIIPDGGVEKWAVSQASPLRRVHIHGDLALDDHGWSSGGFIADSLIDGTVHSGHQQQWITRNSRIGAWESSNWNMVFVGVDGAPAESFPQPPYVTIERAPRTVEKPFLSVDHDNQLGVVVPALSRDGRGVDWKRELSEARFFPIEQFYIADPRSDSATTLNAALTAGKHLLFTPGIYTLNQPLRIGRPDTVALGLGLATLEPTNGNAALEVGDVGGVRLAGLLVAARERSSAVLVRIGTGSSHQRHETDPTLLADVFFRVGGDGIGRADTGLAVDSADAIGDDLWIWRADHGEGAGWDENTSAHGLVVSGCSVTMYGLAVEHFQQAQVVWNGEDGRTYFYQSEEPYDVPAQEAWSSGLGLGYPSYEVAPHVRRHEAWGLGVYCFFHRTPSIKLSSAILAPTARGVRFHDVTTLSLGGGVGEITHLVNDAGDAAQPGHIRSTLVTYPEDESLK